MGIKNLKNFIKKNAPGAFSEINIKKLSGKSICIDSSILLYKYRYMYVYVYILYNIIYFIYQIRMGLPIY